MEPQISSGLPAQVASKKTDYSIYVIGGIAVLALGFFGFVYTGKDGKTFFQRTTSGLKPITREEAIVIVGEFVGTPIANPDGFQTDYLVSRANSIKKGSDTFKVKGKSYSTKTGKVIV